MGAGYASRVNFPAVWTAAKGTAVTPPDIVLGFSEDAANRFLKTHFKNNPDFYDRGRERQPNNPLYEHVFNDHGTQRRVRFWAKAASPVAIDFKQDPQTQKRFAAWWRSTHGTGSQGTTPPNLALAAPDVVLQFNFPKLDGSGGENQLDLPFSIAIAAFARLDQAAGKYFVQLANWDIAVTSIGDPVDPDAPVWGGAPTPPCAQEVKRLRLIIRDLFTLGANVALTQFAQTLTVSLPLPPIDIVTGVSANPRDLTITDTAIAVGLGIQATPLQERVAHAFRSEIGRFEDDLGETDLQEVLAQAPLEKPDELDNYMLANVPAYRNIEARTQALKAKMKPQAKIPSPPLPNNDLFVMLDGAVFDVIAKSLLKADQRDCTPWLTVDLAAFYARGRACYWLNLANAKGGLAGTTVTMGCDFHAGGGLELQACVRIPCHPDECATWSPGLGLAGPVSLAVGIDNSSWFNNKALRLHAAFTNFPGFEIYGLPSGVDQIVNAVINFLTSVVLKAFFNAILSALDIYLIQVPVSLGGTNVQMKLSDMGAENPAGYLTLTGTAAFS